jgi:Ran GTPase-activating protein 1
MAATTTFSLAGKGLKLDTAEDTDKHIGSLASSSTITHIDLSGNTLGVGACAAFATIFPTLPLESADLHDIFTGRLLSEIPHALSSLLTALLKCPKLTTIDLSDNAFGLNTKDPLVEFLSKHTPLQHLILNNNGMGPIAGTSIADALTALAARKAEAGADTPLLESVVCGRNRLENGSMAAWAKAYSAHKDGIKSVKMTQNGIRPEGIFHLLSAGLSQCKKLEVLDMQDNTFTMPGSTALANALPGWSSLLELGVGDSLLGARGAVKVFEALAQGNNKNVEVLRLQYNDITAPGVKAVLQSAKDGLPKLRRVELNGNKFNEDDLSIEALSELLSDRKDEFGEDADPEGHWGLDELDELEEEDSDEEDGEEAEEEDEDARERVLRDADEDEDQKVALKDDKDVDDLAKDLGKTSI